MAESIDPRFLSGPIPGMSLTTEPGNRPWENPPLMHSVQEVANFYSERLLEEDTQEAIVAALDKGIAVDTMTEQLTTSAVMEGYHNIDVSVLVTPIVRELIMYVGDINDIEYTVSYREEQKKGKVPYKLAKQIAEEVMQEAPEEDVVAAEGDMPVRKGLMAKRSAE